MNMWNYGIFFGKLLWGPIPILLHVCSGGGGGEGNLHNMHIGYVLRERPPFSALNFRSGAYHFHKLPHKKSVPEHHHFTFFGGFCRFKIYLISTRSSPPTAGSARTQSVRQRRELAAGQSASQTRLAVPETRIFTLKTDQARSGAPHFQAQNGWSSFRSPAFSRSTRSSLRSPGPFFTLPRHTTYQNLGWVPPLWAFWVYSNAIWVLGLSPPPPPRALNSLSHRSSGPQYELICIQPIRDRAYSFAYSQSTAGDSTLGIY